MSGQGRLRVGLVGAGMISRHHLLAWQKLSDHADLVAICDPDLARAGARAEEFGIGAACASADELFETHRLDALDIASPRTTHAEWVRAGLARGVAVLCQKPLTPTLAESRRLMRDIGGARVMVHENWRFNPLYRELRAEIAAGRLGAIRMARASYLSSAFLVDESGNAPGFARQPSLRTEPRLFIAEAFIHHIDVMRCLCGPLRLVAARAARTVAGIPGETLAALFLETAHGAPLELFGNMAAPGHPPRGSDELDIIGDKASARVRASTMDILGPDANTRTYDPERAYQGCFDGAIAHFVDALRSGAPFETDIFDNIETLELVEHAYAAAGLHGTA